jgi:hypothetical protein
VRGTQGLRDGGEERARRRDAGLASILHGDAWHKRASRNSPPSIANACALRKRLP